MTITSTTNRVEATGNGVTTSFAFGYKFLANADLKVYQEGTLKTITTHYTVTGAGNDAGGTVTFVTAPANLDEIVIIRDPAITQETDLVENDPLPAETVEDTFDKLTMIAQRLDDRLDRSLVVSDTDTSGADLTVPAPEASKLLSWNATADGLTNVAIGDIGATTLPISIANGGTGATDAATARTNLGISGSITSSGYTQSTSRVLGRATAASGAIEELTLSGVLDLIGSAAQGDILYRDASGWARLGAGTSGHFLKTQGAGANPAWAASASGITLGTPVSSTSGTSIDFTGIPDGTKRIVISFDGVSTNGTSIPLVQIGDSGGIETSGYLGSAGANTYTTGIGLTDAWAATSVVHGAVTLTLVSSSSNTWAATIILGRSNTAYSTYGGFSKSTSATLDRVRITTVGGADTFDAGTINIMYE